jgi:hypothetical protein
MSMRNRLRRLEQLYSGRERPHCPACPPQAIVYYRQDRSAAEPVLQEGEQLPDPCPGCGRPVDVFAIVEDPDFFLRRDD